MEQLSKETKTALIACTIRRDCAACCFENFGEAKVVCQQRLLEAIRDDLLMPKLYKEDK